MADIHFFIELDKLPVYDASSNPNTGQSGNDAYGPVSGFETTKYRTTSGFTLQTGETPIAYAACDGTILVQPQFDDNTNTFSPDRVNVILKPFVSPDNGHNAVEYFIYRGLRRDSFLQASSTSLIPETTADISDFMKEVWIDFHEAVNKGITYPAPPNPPPGSPSHRRIGVHWDTENELTTLEEVFNNNKIDSITGTAIQLSTALKGWSIGKFDSNGPIGFEIVLRDKLFTPLLKTARAIDHIITAPAPGSGAVPGDLPIQQMRIREAILNFIDPAAYFMTFDEVDYRTSTVSNVQNTAGVIGIAQTLLPPFYTKDIVYIDVRNEFGYSINYHKDSQGESSDSASQYGKHFQMIENGGAVQTLNYYVDFWPIFTTSIINTTSTTLNLVDLAFRIQYYPDQVLFVDFGSLVNNQSAFTPSNSNKFIDATYVGVPTNFTEPYEGFAVFNLPTEGYAPTQILRLILIRKTAPSIPLPISSIPRDEYLDNIFGPLKPYPTMSSPILVVERSLGKRYINLNPIAGMDFIVEVFVLFEADRVLFLADIVAYRPVSSTINQVVDAVSLKFTKGNVAGTSATNYVKELFSEVLRFSKLELNDQGGSPIIIPSYFFDASQYDKRQFLFGIALTRNEYVNQLLPAAALLDASLHDTYINLVTFNENTGTQIGSGADLKYYDTVIRVSGFDTLGNYQEILPVSGNIVAYSFDKVFISTSSFGWNTDPDVDDFSDPNGAYLDYEDYLKYVEKVEEVYLSEDKIPAELNSSVKNTATRIRVHSYGIDGSPGFFGTFYIGRAFEAALPDSDYYVGVGDKRNLELEEMKKVTDGALAYNKINSNADENWFRDNPSPYVRINTANQPTFRQVDTGQILYGLESLIIPDTLNPTIGFGYTTACNGYPIDIPFDLTGVIANIATPVAETLYHRIFGLTGITKGLLSDQKYTPTSADLFAYYEISAPEVDLLGNADAIGVSKAYTELKNNNDVKLSDVLKLYYKSIIPSGMTLAGLEPFYTVERRWLIFALHFKLVKQVGMQYRWMPDATSSTDVAEWQATKTGIVNRMYYFSEFWWNHFIGVNAEKTLQRTIYGRDSYIERFVNRFAPTELTNINNDIETVLSNIFLPFVKNELLLEDASIII